MSVAHIGRMIDHTLLSPVATPEEIVRLCKEAQQHEFYAVCVNPVNVRLASDILSGTPVLVCSTVGFPLGATFADVKYDEAMRALHAGARELDMVINLGALKQGDRRYVRDEIARIVLLARSWRAKVKVIIETCVLTESEKILACTLAMEAGADFVKTSTGMLGALSGANEVDVRLLRHIASPNMGIKASGGVSHLALALTLMKAGADRIGTSHGVSIIGEWNSMPAAERPKLPDMAAIRR